MSSSPGGTLVNVTEECCIEFTSSSRRHCPTYVSDTAGRARSRISRWSVFKRIDLGFSIAATAAVLWLTWVVLRSSFDTHPAHIANLLIFWLVLTYLALPRIHQVLTSFYVPDYFIGRTRNGDGLLGDPVNLALLGSQQQICEVMTQAGWCTADPITPRTAWHTIAATLGRHSYPTSPVSNLYLFGREQDLVFQKESDGNPANRHHVRFWHVPEGWCLPGGHHVEWVAAGTFDRSVGLSAFTWQVTHKIDENVDTERDYIVEDMQWACPEARHRVIEGFSTSYRSRNGGGDNIVTDGHLPVIDLREVPSHTTRMTSDTPATGRPRPASLVFGVILPLVWTLCAGTSWMWHHVVTGDTSGAQLSWLPWLGSASLPIAWVLGTVMMGVLICSAVATWRGHPRGRVIFEAALLAHIIITGMQIEASTSHTMTSMLTMMCSVLALVAVTSQRSRQWSAQTKAAALKLQESDSCKSETAGIKPSDDGYLAAEQVDVGTRRVLAPILTQSTNGTRKQTVAHKTGAPALRQFRDGQRHIVS